ncbi:MarR family transcriptional regulator [bacterium C-53]|nr:MarR family transcriptional regulator [Lachnospiraceae bacterium]NBI02411.1 MarR family transcriptional regulator [Lachnospiraceae bacterium]RKJ11517.1 MarR family transcriptional regulator [bacterium C-53]
MNCPCCQNEMQAGYIPNWSQPVHWLPEGKRPSIFSHTVTGSGVPLLNQFKPLSAFGYKAEAYYCQKCKMVIARTKE